MATFWMAFYSYRESFQQVHSIRKREARSSDDDADALWHADSQRRGDRRRAWRSDRSRWYYRLCDCGIAGLRYQAMLPPLSVGFVSAIGVILIAPLSSWTAPFGARLAHRLPKRWLEIGFGLFLLLIALRFLASLVFPAI
jgi:hypothetical protein